jgi:L-alanine-DL-glutamate epimerase-like enolase superfamily enzyme
MPFELRFLSLPIAFRQAFSHASASRKFAENVIVMARDQEGRVGLGEGCPRPYVTGETLEAAQSFLTAHLPLLSNIQDLDGLRSWSTSNKLVIDLCPSAFCAAELALLDLIAQRDGVSVETLLGLPPIINQPLSAVYSASGGLAFSAQHLAFRARGIRDAKLKISGNSARDMSRARQLSRFGSVRVDANNLWRDAAQAIKALTPLTPFIWAVEEPCSPKDWASMTSIQTTTGLTLIADESVTKVEDLEEIPTGLKVAINLRVSKHGGLIRTLDLLRAAQNRGFDVIIGAQVGETSILARAALSVAAIVPRLRGFEAGYGTWLLQFDVTEPAIKAQLGAKLIAELQAAPGLGLSPSQRLKGEFECLSV